MLFLPATAQQVAPSSVPLSLPFGYIVVQLGTWSESSAGCELVLHIFKARDIFRLSAMHSYFERRGWWTEWHGDGGTLWVFGCSG